MIRIRRWNILLLAMSCTLGGCAGLSNGAPPVFRLQQEDAANATHDSLAPIRDAIQADCLDISAPHGPTEAKAMRNRLVTAYMFGVDVAYNQYERQLLDAVRQNDLGASSASLALSTIGAVVGEQALAQALSTTNALVTGTHTAISRDYLFNQTLTTLQTQMRASRAHQRATILLRLKLDYDDWNSCTALSDVLAYEQAGTLNAALAEVSASATLANREGQAQVQAAIPIVAPATSATATALDAFISPEDEELWPSRIDVALRVLRAKNLMPLPGLSDNRRLIEILDDTSLEREADRRALIQGIIDDPSVDEALKPPLRAAIGG